jgi:hypothetical protein
VTLYPFVTAWICPTCKWKETYYVDTWQRERGEVIIKSFERSHLERRLEVAQGLEDWAVSDPTGNGES